MIDHEVVTAESARLDELYPGGFLRIISIENRTKGSTAGQISEVSTRTAARQIVDGVARPYTPEEIPSVTP